MIYKIVSINAQVIFIRWYTSPMVGSAVEKEFLAEIQAILEKAEKPVYFLSDLRHGRITNISILRQLGSLAKHPNWGAGASYANDPMSTVFAGIFTRFANKSKREDGIWYNPNDAINSLKKLNPELFEGIDWTRVLSEDASAMSN